MATATVLPTPLERQPEDQSQHLWRWLCLLLVIYSLITPWGIQNQSVSNPDEPIYASTARHMLRGGDKFEPVFNTELHHEKPIMFHWVLVASGTIGMALGLPMLTALHLGPLFMGLLATLATFFIGRRFRDSRFGFMAALVVITAHRYHDLSRSLLTDMTLNAFLIWSWFFFLVAVDRLERKVGAILPLLGFYVCLGAACMAKGPVLVGVFTVAPMIVFLYWNGQVKVLLRAGLWWGLPLALGIGMWWFGLIMMRGHSDDVSEFFTWQNFGRLTKADGADWHPIPYLFYLESLGDAFFPWCILLPVVLWWSWRSWRALPPGGMSWQARLLVCAILLPFAGFGLSGNKRSVYLVPLYPFLALYVTWMVEHAFLRVADAAQTPAPWRYRTVVAILAVACVLTLGEEIVIRPNRERFYARAEFYEKVDQLSAGRPVMICGLSIFESVWYLDRPQQLIEDCDHHQLLQGFVPPPDRVLIMPEEYLTRFPEVQKNFTVLSTALKTRGITYAAVMAKSPVVAK